MTAQATLRWPFPNDVMLELSHRLSVVAQHLITVVETQPLPAVLCDTLLTILRQPNKLLGSPVVDHAPLRRQDGGLWPLHVMLLHAALAHEDQLHPPTTTWYEVIPVAVCMELLGTAADIFDDIQDGDGLLFDQIGPAQLTNAAIVLLTLAHQVLLQADMPCGLVRSAQSILTAAVVSSSGGQSLDIWFEQCEEVSLDEAIAMTEQKSGSLVGLTYQLTTLWWGFARYDEVLLAHLCEKVARFGRYLGTAMQLENDMKDATRDERTHKSDRRRNKKTVPLLIEHKATRSEIDAELHSQFVADALFAIFMLQRHRAQTQLTELVDQFHLSSQWLDWLVTPEAATSNDPTP